MYSVPVIVKSFASNGIAFASRVSEFKKPEVSGKI